MVTILPYPLHKEQKEVRKMVKSAKLFMLSLVCILLWGGNVASAGQTIVIKGSTTVLPVTQAAAEAYMKLHPGVNISLSGGGSGEGIKALIDRSTDIATSSRDIKKEEIKLARSRGANPVAHRVAIDAIVPIVHPTNPVKNLTAEQLSLIYQGKITNWREVGGKDLKIVVISRDSSSGTYETWGEQDPLRRQGDTEGTVTGIQWRHCSGGFKKQVCHGLYRNRLSKQNG